MSCLKQMQTFFSIIVQHKSIPIPYYHLNRSWRHVLLQIILPCARCRDRQFKLICFACFVVLPSQRLKAAITCFCRWLIGCLANRLVDKFCLSLLSHREQRPTEPRLYQAAWQHRVSCGECGEKPRGGVQLRGRGKPTSHVPVSAWLQSFISLFLLSLLMLHAFIQVIVSISFNFLTSCLHFVLTSPRRILAAENATERGLWQNSCAHKSCSTLAFLYRTVTWFFALKGSLLFVNTCYLHVSPLRRTVI